MSINKLREVTISQKALEWFESKGIDCEIVNYAGIYTQQYDEDNLWVAFPCYDDEGEVANNRMGTLRDNHLIDITRMDGGRDMFYNIQALDLAAKEGRPLVVCQREMDVLSFLQAGYAWVIGFIEGDEYLWDSLSKFKGIGKIVLAGYANEAGKVFNETVSKKLGLGKCAYVEFPEGCVTANDVLVRHDGGKLNTLISEAKNYPVVGLYKPDEFPSLPEIYKKPYSTGMGRSHDHHIKIMLGKFMVITGIPGHGKSEWADSLVLNLAKIHGWNVCVCSTEIDHEEYKENTIRRYLRRPLANVGPNEPDKAAKFYQDKYTFITNTTMEEEIELTLEKLIDLAVIAILRDNCKVLLLDPWNEIEHKRANGETETDYTNRAIQKLKKLARQYGILVIVVAHPTKPPGGKVEPPGLYWISGSSNWANKPDYGVILWREDVSRPESQVLIRKIKRHGEMGRPGDINVKLNDHTRNFEEVY